VIYDLALYQVKKPSESRYPWDYYKKDEELPGETSFRDERAGGCKLVESAGSKTDQGAQR
jgi:branched-chain amino acid transport system substrate-binding protein